VGEFENQPIDLLPSPPTPPSCDFCENLDCKLDGFHVVLSPQPSSFSPFDPSDFGVLCSSISDLTCDVHEDQFFHRVGVEYPTCAIIFYEYMWESEQESMVKDGLLMFAPRPLYPDIFYDSSISILSSKNSFPDFSNSDHS